MVDLGEQIVATKFADTTIVMLLDTEYKRIAYIGGSAQQSAGQAYGDAAEKALALEAADLSLAHGLGMADSLVYATARRFGATLVTGDADFEGLPDTVVIR